MDVYGLPTGLIYFRVAAQAYYFRPECMAHDWYHIDRVRNMALRIAYIEGGDKKLIEIAALAHDVGDHKFHASAEEADQALRRFLLEGGIGDEYFDRVVDIAQRVSFMGLDVPDDMPTLEGKIVQDADRLDAIGAIAIARTFTWGGSQGRPMYDPDIPLLLPQTREEYLKKSGKTSFNHIFEKLVHLKDRLHTDTARKIAQKRHDFMIAYTEQFKAEWDGQD